MPANDSDPEVPCAVIENIDEVIALEERSEQDRPRVERWAGSIGSFIGTIAFVAVHLSVFTLWILVNTRMLAWVEPFDPYPFALLSTIFSVESVLLTTFVLITQNRMGQQADHRAHLDLQVNLLTEKEVTKLIHILDRVAARLDVQDPSEAAEIREMSNETAVAQLSAKFEKRAASERQ
jgi:uncharacterized membrane protein